MADLDNGDSVDVVGLLMLVDRLGRCAPIMVWVASVLVLLETAWIVRRGSSVDDPRRVFRLMGPFRRQVADLEGAVMCRNCRSIMSASFVALFFPLVLASSAPAQTATVSCSLTSTVVDRGNPVIGNVTISPVSGSNGPYDLTVSLIDNSGRVFDRYETRLNVAARLVVPFSLNSTHALTMQCSVQAKGKFVAGTIVDAATVTMTMVPYAFDYDDYWCNVWGSGNTSLSSYFNALKLANVNTGHIYRQASYSGYLYNLRPNNDFLEDKLWFEQASTSPLPETLLAAYKTYLNASTYGSAAARQNLVRPTSINDAASLTIMENTIRPRMQASRKWRPMQWNIADEYGLFRRANPYDFDLGPAAINQFVTWLQTRYGTIAALNSTWNTHFTAFSDLSDPIHAAAGGEAALIVTQEIRDREFPLWSSTTTAKNFAPWSDFRTFMDESFAAAMKRCVDVGRLIDPAVRVGFEGAEPATPSTGYDYARQLHEIGSIESYDTGNGPEYIRSMRYDRYGQRIFSFITLFNSSVQDNKYTLWYRLLHYGVTGAPIWASQDVDVPTNNFFTSLSTFGLTSYATGVSSTFAEFQNGLVKLLNQGDWDDNEVALLYSQKSIQALWQLDSEADGRSWINRSNSWEPLHSSLFSDHVGWCKALEDIGIKGRFISYDEVAGGVLTSRGVKVLILPKTMALSDAEKTAIQDWVNAGGVLIADNQCGYFDGYLRRQAISSGGGWWDSFLGITRTSYATTERNGTFGSSAFSGTPTFQAAPAGFGNLTSGLTASGLYAVEAGVRAAPGATAMALFNNSAAQPALIVRTHGAGKIVYMNLSLYRYGWTNSATPDERQAPGSASASNVRQLIKNLVALGGVTPRVAVKQGWNNPTGNDVYNLEKSLHVSGQNKIVGCVINSYEDGTNDWWGSRSDTASVCFGQAGVTNANATLVLTSPANVYDVRKGSYLGYGSQFNVTMPVYEGSVFAVLPYHVDHLDVSLVQYDSTTQAATVTARVVPTSGVASNHVLRIEVFDAANNPLSHLSSKIVATDGTWTGVIPFAITDNVTNIRVHVTDVATSVAVDKTLTKHKGDINGDGDVDVVDLLIIADSFGLTVDDPGFDPTCDFNADKAVDVVDLLTFADDFGKTAP